MHVQKMLPESYRKSSPLRPLPKRTPRPTEKNSLRDKQRKNTLTTYRHAHLPLGPPSQTSISASLSTPLSTLHLGPQSQPPSWPSLSAPCRPPLGPPLGSLHGPSPLGRALSPPLASLSSTLSALSRPPLSTPLSLQDSEYDLKSR